VASLYPMSNLFMPGHRIQLDVSWVVLPMISIERVR